MSRLFKRGIKRVGRWLSGQTAWYLSVKTRGEGKKEGREEGKEEEKREGEKAREEGRNWISQCVLVPTVSLWWSRDGRRLRSWWPAQLTNELVQWKILSFRFDFCIILWPRYVIPQSFKCFVKLTVYKYNLGHENKKKKKLKCKY